MRLYVVFLSLMIASCNDHPASFYNTGYDDELFQYNRKAEEGDLNATYDAGMQCEGILKLDPSELPAMFLGKCGSFDALAIENAIMNGDPEKIDDIIEFLSRIQTVINQPSETRYGELVRYPKRKEFYMDIAQYSIQKRCAEPKPPASCQDKELLKKFGLERTFYNELKPITVPIEKLAKTQ
jgi:hypothetical protein